MKHIPTPKYEEVRSDFSRLTPEESAVFEAVMERYLDIEIELYIARGLAKRPKDRYAIPFRSALEREVETSLHPGGQHVGFPKIQIETWRMQRLLSVIDALNQDNRELTNLIIRTVESATTGIEKAVKEAKDMLVEYK